MGPVGLGRLRRSGTVTHRSILGVGIRHPEGGQNLGLESFHGKGLVVVDVIIAEQVQKAMHHQMGEMVLEADPLLRRLPLERLAGKDDVAQQPGNRAERLDLGETEDVCRLVDAAPVAVQHPLLGIVGAVVATWLGQAVGWYGEGEAAGFIGAVVGAILLLLIYRFVRGRTA